MRRHSSRSRMTGVYFIRWSRGVNVLSISSRLWLVFTLFSLSLFYARSLFLTLFLLFTLFSLFFGFSRSFLRCSHVFIYYAVLVGFFTLFSLLFLAVLTFLCCSHFFSLTTLFSLSSSRH